jgi:ubiquinone/menaquinone biosynthesis C-methylase UbiE
LRRVSRNIQLRELLVGVEGLALLRHLYDGTDGDAERRLAEVRRLLDDSTLSERESIIEADARLGYSSWASTYDTPGNLIVALEEPAVWSIIEHWPRGRALDAACGTGRHARRLAELGHDVAGLDLTRHMLLRARDGVPAAVFAEADLRHLPAADEVFDGIVCGLALAHVRDVAAVIAEFARVLRPRGRLVASVLHPFQAMLGWHAPFEGEDGQRRVIREHPHTHSDYLDAFEASALQLRRCIEPKLSQREVAAKRRAFRHVPEAAIAAYVGLPAVLVWEVEKNG